MISKDGVLQESDFFSITRDPGKMRLEEFQGAMAKIEDWGSCCGFEGSLKATVSIASKVFLPE
jgi:hypothetical protein